MKITGLILGLLMGCAPAMAGNFIEAVGGDGVSIELGHSWGLLDVSGGYLRAYNGDSTLSEDAVVNVVDLEVGRRFTLPYGFTAGINAGAGYAMPTLENGIDRADPGHAWLLGGSLSYAITPSWSLGASVRNIFFTTDTKSTIYSSHEEILSTGQTVSVTDVTEKEDSTKLNTISYGLALRLSF